MTELSAGGGHLGSPKPSDLSAATHEGTSAELIDLLLLPQQEQPTWTLRTIVTKKTLPSHLNNPRLAQSAKQTLQSISGMASSENEQ